MSSIGLAKKAGYIGAGAGLTLFAIIGLLPGSFFGGSVGLSIAGGLFGSPVSPGLMSRVIVAAAMLLGVLITGIVFVVGGTVIGWTMGNMVEGLPMFAYFTGGKKTKKNKSDDSGQGISK